MAEVFPNLFDNVKREYSLCVCSLARLDHPDIVANAFHLLAFLLDKLPLVNVDDVHLAPLELDISLLLLSTHYLLAQIGPFRIIVKRAEVARTLLNVLLHERELRTLEHLLVLEHLLKLIQRLLYLRQLTLVGITSLRRVRGGGVVVVLALRGSMWHYLCLLG